MLTSLLIALAFLLISMAALLNFQRFYQATENILGALLRLARTAKAMFEALARAYRRSSRTPYYS